MIHGVGVDLIEIDRIKKIYQRQDKLIERVLSINEQSVLTNLIMKHGK